MMTSHEARERIRRNIATHGHHTYLVSGAPTPRWAYTIGLSPRVGFELILAGASTFSKNEVLEIIGDLAANRLSKNFRRKRKAFATSKPPTTT